MPKVIGHLLGPIYRVTWITLLTSLLAHGARRPPEVVFDPQGLHYTFEVPPAGVIGSDATLD